MSYLQKDNGNLVRYIAIFTRIEICENKKYQTNFKTLCSYSSNRYSTELGTLSKFMDVIQSLYAVIFSVPSASSSFDNERAQ